MKKGLHLHLGWLVQSIMLCHSFRKVKFSCFLRRKMLLRRLVIPYLSKRYAKSGCPVFRTSPES